ncbi:histidine phosphatase family protein [Acanthopleuribacter pedis]|uniref:Histidine phosphatase family protein n=1 Tax=Acanthopleuribacter pedis TaxID=442870 RepID=A0A8J7QP20_9BACT|nr:histidine phosphatase family protein [Acanthopleuribacter pedis]MBO1321505.1 histidine phosphatase family protein [Acanthopleuribacter pedis]
MRLYLVRHPRVDAPKNVCYGQADLACALGWQDQLPNAARLLPTEATIRVVSSPLRRCRVLAEAWVASYAPGRDILIEPDLMELSFGEWEGRLWSEIDRADIDLWAQSTVGYAAPGGESLQQLADRVAAVIARLPMDGPDHVVFCHSGVIRVITAMLLGMPLENTLRFEVAHLSVTLLERHALRPRLLYFNRV